MRAIDYRETGLISASPMFSARFRAVYSSDIGYMAVNFLQIFAYAFVYR